MQPLRPGDPGFAGILRVATRIVESSMRELAFPVDVAFVAAQILREASLVEISRIGDATKFTVRDVGGRWCALEIDSEIRVEVDDGREKHDGRAPIAGVETLVSALLTLEDVTVARDVAPIGRIVWARCSPKRQLFSYDDGELTVFTGKWDGPIEPVGGLPDEGCLAVERWVAAAAAASPESLRFGDSAVWSEELGVGVRVERLPLAWPTDFEILEPDSLEARLAASGEPPDVYIELSTSGGPMASWAKFGDTMVAALATEEYGNVLAWRGDGGRVFPTFFYPRAVGPVSDDVVKALGADPSTTAFVLEGLVHRASAPESGGLDVSPSPRNRALRVAIFRDGRFLVERVDRARAFAGLVDEALIGIGGLGGNVSDGPLVLTSIGGSFTATRGLVHWVDFTPNLVAMERDASRAVGVSRLGDVILLVASSTGASLYNAFLVAARSLEDAVAAAEPILRDAGIGISDGLVGAAALAGLSD